MGPKYLESIVGACGLNVWDRVVRIEVRGPKIDDESVTDLEQLRHLREIQLRDTRISSQWIEAFQKKRPDCEIESETALVFENAT